MDFVARRIAALLLVLMLGTAVIAIATVSRPLIDAVTIAPGEDLTEAERIYLGYMYPRIVALDTEVTEITVLVNERSRNIFVLTSHGDRIRELVAQINQAPGVDDLRGEYRTLHERSIALGTTLESILDTAERSLVRFDFGAIPDLIPRFDRASVELGEVRNEMSARSEVGSAGTLAGDDTAARFLSKWTASVAA